MSSGPPFRRKPNFLLYWLPPLLWCLAIISMSGDMASSKNTRYWLYWLVSWFTTVKLGELTQVNAILRKIGHSLSYGMLYFLWFRAFAAHMGLSLGRACVVSLGLCLAMAMTDEGHQSFAATRGGSIADIFLDMSGAGLAALVTAVVWTPRRHAPTVPGIGGEHPPRPE